MYKKCPKGTGNVQELYRKRKEIPLQLIPFEPKTFKPMSTNQRRICTNSSKSNLRNKMQKSTIDLTSSTNQSIVEKISGCPSRTIDANSENGDHLEVGN
jgi:hypothetical protein